MRMKLNNIEEALSLLNNKDLVFMIKKIKNLKKSFVFQGSFDNKREIFIEVKSRIIASLYEIIKDYRERVSVCRKKGISLNLISLDLMRIYFKIKMFKVNFNLDYFNKINKKLLSIKKDLIGFESKLGL